jgi:hypothetical protein
MAEATDPAAAARPAEACGKALRHVLSITAPAPIAEEARAALAGLPATDQD